jgi:hypothetical protein
MSASAATLTTEEYDQRKLFLEELKVLVKGELEEIYKVLRKHRCEISENSNGVFFDLCKVPADAFKELQGFMEFCRQNRIALDKRDEEEKKAEEALYYGSA